ncbi:MAG: FAD-dependent oxidoreductase [Bdellovibrio sp.]
MIILRSGDTVSTWAVTESFKEFRSLQSDIDCDVCVVGGGIAGMTTAYLLAKRGKSVCVLESSQVGSGQTGRTTAHFTAAIDVRYFELEKSHGKEKSRLVAESHSAAIDLVEGIIEQENISCEHERVPGYLFARDDQRPQLLQKELAACHRAGLNEVKLLEKSPLDFFDLGPTLQFPQQMQLHPLKYINGLAKSILAHKGQIFSDTHVVETIGGIKAATRTQRGFTVRSKAVVIATNTPINDLVAIHTKQAPYRTYVLSFEIAKGTIAHGLYWDTLDPYHYFRLERSDQNHDLLIIGGEDHKTGQEENPEKRFSELETWARGHFPMAGEVVNRWSGQIMESIDGLAFLGHNPMDKNNVYVITGDSGSGMTHSTIGAMIVSDQIMGQKNLWEELYNPSRIPIRAIKEFVKENTNVALQYGQWLVAKSHADIQNLPVGEGTVFRHGRSMIAAYKDSQGDVELLSAACPHLAGVVSWNKVEKSWDCPCHGSRFDCHGQVIEGPAFSNMHKIKQDDFTAAQSNPERSVDL